MFFFSNNNVGLGLYHMDLSPTNTSVLITITIDKDFITFSKACIINLEFQTKFGCINCE